MIDCNDVKLKETENRCGTSGCVWATLWELLKRQEKLINKLILADKTLSGQGKSSKKTLMEAHNETIAAIDDKFEDPLIAQLLAGKLPEWDEIDEIAHAAKLNPLEEFIYIIEPQMTAGQAGRAIFRRRLLATIVDILSRRQK